MTSSRRRIAWGGIPHSAAWSATDFTCPVSVTVRLLAMTKMSGHTMAKER